MFNGEVTYKSYNEYVNDIKTFSNYSIIGQDSSGEYDLYRIDIGDSTKPSIMVTSGVHGNEWQSVYYTMDFMKQLEDGTFPDPSMRGKLLSEYHIVYIPMVNPHGVDEVKDPYRRIGDPARPNSNGVDLNRDLINRTQVETNIFIAEYDEVQPFAYLDCHLYQPYYGLDGGNNLIIGKGNEQSLSAQTYMSDHTENATGEEVTRWGMVNNYPKMFIGYAGGQNNPHTPYTLSLLTELIRPAYNNDSEKDYIVRKLTDKEIYEQGNLMNYLFFKSAINFYDTHNPAEDSEIVEVATPNGLHQLSRDAEGLLIGVTTTMTNGRIITTVLNRDGNGYIDTINRTEPPL